MAETIELTCKGNTTLKSQNGAIQPLQIEYNLTIIGNDSRSGKVLINDKNQNESSEFGDKQVIAFSINKSEINFTTEYKSPARYLPNGILQTEGIVRRLYYLSRTTGVLTQTTFSQGGLAKYLNDEGVKVIELMCDKRAGNKF